MYELRVIDPSGAENNRAAATSLLVSLFVANTGSWLLFPAHVDVQIVDRQADQVVFERRVAPDVARLLAIDVDKDLDRLDVEDFAREWGIGVQHDADATNPRVRLRDWPRKLRSAYRLFSDRGM